MSRFIFLIPLFLIVFNPAIASDIVELIKSGKLNEARQKMALSQTATRRDGTLLYYQALLEEDGKKSLDFLEAAFKAEMSAEYLEDNIYRQALYLQAACDFDKLVTTTGAYLDYWDNGQYRSEMIRLKAFGLEKLDKNREATQYRRQLTKDYKDGKYGIIGKLDMARQLYSDREYILAQDICRPLGNSKIDLAAAPALYMLSYYSINQKRIDDAILYYNLLRERYPYSVGLYDLINRLSSIKSKTDNRAEKLTGTVYSVKVGVFSVKDNAQNMSDRMKKYGEKIDIERKNISDKYYYVVYIGHFQSMEQAMAFKAQLEGGENEAFQVVIR